MPLPTVEAPQGIYGYTVQPLEAGEVWVQDVELGYLSGQFGLGAGWDATVGAVVIPRAFWMPNVELGWSHRFGAATMRGTLGAGLPVNFPRDFTETSSLGTVGLIGGLVAGWGEGPRELNVGVRAATGVDGDNSALFVHVDGRWRFTPGFAMLFGGVGAARRQGDWVPLAFLVGPAARFGVGAFSLDVGVQVIGGQGFSPCSGPCLYSWYAFPLPSFAVRYGFGAP